MGKRYKMSIIIFLLIIVLAVAIFSVQNAAPVEITFLLWKFEASLAIVIFLSVLTGVAIMAIIVFSGRIKQHIKK